MFVARIDVSPKEVNKSTVECLAYNHHKGQTWLWCGLSTGEIQLVQLEGYHIKQRLQAHRQIVTCVKVVNDSFLWSGSFDTTIKVTNMMSKKLVATLEAHTDAITCMANDGNGCLWSASINGQLLRWSIDQKKLDDWPSDFQLQCPRTKKTLSLYSMVLIEDHIWCGTGSSIAIFDPKKRRVVEHIVSADGTSYTSRDKDDTKPNTPLPSADDSAAADAGWGMPRNRTVPSRVRSASTGTTVRDAARAAVSARQRLQHTASPVLGGGAGVRDGWVLLDAPTAPYSASVSPSKVPSGPRGFPRPGDSPLARRKAPLFTPLTPPSPFSGAHASDRSMPSGQVRYTATEDVTSPMRLTANPRQSPTALATSRSQRDSLNDASHMSRHARHDAQHDRLLPQSLYTPTRAGSTLTTLHGTAGRTGGAAGVLPSQPRTSSQAPPPPHLLSEFWDGGGAAATSDATTKLSLSPVRLGAKHSLVSPQRMTPHHRTHRGADGHSGHRQQAVGVASVVASHCIVTGSDGQLWTSSESKGLVQVWSTVTKQLLQSWELSCPGINHVVHARGHMWVAGSTGSVYIWDAGLRVPVAEINAHSDAVRGLCAVGTGFVLSHSGFKDGSIGVFRAVARGRLISASKLDDNTVQSYDRYGFCLASEASPHRSALAYMDGSEGGPVSSEGEDILSTSLPEAWKQEATSKQDRYAQHIKAWEEFWAARQVSTAQDGLQSNQEFQRLLDACGIPEKFRTLVWPELLSAWLGSSVNEVDASFRRSRRISTKMYKQIELDLHRTFPSNKHFQTSGAAIRKLRRVLHAFVTYNTSVQYCQGFNFIAAFALLFLTETLAMRAVVCIIEHIMPKGYYTDPMLASRADQPVLRECVTAHLPAIDAILQQHEFDLSIVTFNWFFTAFVDCVPVDIVVLVWDMLFTYGDITLFRFAYALLKSHEATIIAVKDPFDMFVTMRSLGNTCPDAETMLTWVNACPITRDFVEQRRRFHRDTITAADRDVQQVLLERRRLERLKLQGKGADALPSAAHDSTPEQNGPGAHTGADESLPTNEESMGRTSATTNENPPVGNVGLTPTGAGEATQRDCEAAPQGTRTVDDETAPNVVVSRDESGTGGTANADERVARDRTAEPSDVASDHAPTNDADSVECSLDFPMSTGPTTAAALNIATSATDPSGPDTSVFASFVTDEPTQDDEDGEGRKDRLGSTVSNASRDSTDSWMEVDGGYDMRPRAVPFEAKSSHMTVFNATQTGGTGDGILHPTGTTLAQSMSRWVGTRMSLGRTIPTGPKWTPGCSSGSSNDVLPAAIAAIEEQDVMIGGSMSALVEPPPLHEPPNNSLCNRYISMEAVCARDATRDAHRAAEASYIQVPSMRARNPESSHSRSNSGSDATLDIFFPQMDDSEDDDFF